MKPFSTPTKKRWALLLGGVVFLFLILHLPPTKRAVASLVAGTLSWWTGGPVELGSLDYALWRGDVELNELHVAPDRSRLPIELRLEQAGIHVSPLGGLTVRLESPELTVFQQEGQAAPSEGFSLGSLGSLVPSQLLVTNGTVRVLTATDDPWLEIRSIALGLGKSSGAIQVDLRATNGTLVQDTTTVLFGPLQGAFALRGDELHIESVRMEKEDSAVDLSGTITSLEPFEGHLEANLRVDTALLQDILPGIDVRGTVEGHARLDGEPAGLSATGDLHSAALAWNGWEPWGLNAEATLANDSLRVEPATLTGYGGTVRAIAQVDLAEERQSLQIDLEGLDVERAMADMAPSPIPVASRASGHLELATTGWDLQAAAGQGVVTLDSSGAPAGSSVPVRGEVQLALREGTASLETRGLSIPQATLSLDAHLTPVAATGNLQASYRARVNDLRAAARLAPESSWNLDGLEGGLSLQGQGGGLLSDTSWNGTVTGENLTLQGEPYALAADLHLARARLRVQSLSVHDTEGTGALVVEGEAPLASSAGAWDLHGEVSSFQLAHLPPLAGSPLQGQLNGRFDVSGDASDPDWSAELDVADLPVPREGEATVTLRKSGRELRVESARLVSPAGSLDGSGSYELDDGRVALRARAEGIRLADLPILASIGEADGTIDSVDVELEGPVRAPTGVVRFNVREPSWRGVSLPDLDVELWSDGETAELQARLDQGDPLLTARGELQSPYPIVATLDLSALPVERLLQSDLLLGDPEVRAQVSGELEVSFPLLDPGQIHYQARVDQLVGSYHGIGGGAGSTFRIEGDRQAFDVVDLDVIGSGTAIAISGRFPLAPGQESDFHVRGDARLELLAPAFPELEPSGRASAELYLQGTPDRPVLTGDATLQDVAATIHGVRVDALDATVVVDRDRIRLRSLDGRTLEGAFHLEGEFPLRSAPSTEVTSLQFEIADVDLARLLDEQGTPDSQATLKMTVSGSLETAQPSLQAVSGSGSVSHIEAGFGELILGNPSPATWSLSAGRFDLSGLRLTATDTDVQIGIVATLTDGVAWEASLEGRLGNALADPLLAGEGITLGGVTQVDLRARGTSEDFELEGTGVFDDGRAVLREPPLAVSNLQGDLHFQQNRITVSGLTAEVGGGQVEGSGTIDLAGVVDLQLTAESVRLNYPEDLRSESSGSVHLTGGPESYLLSGDVWVLQSLFNGTLSLESPGFESMPDLRLTTQEATFAERLRLDLRAQTVEDLRIDSDLAKLQAAGNLTFSGALASPEIDGVITLRPDGTFRLGRNTYRIESGQMVLRSFPTESPELQLSMRTTVSDVGILMNVQGPLDDLTTNLSAPEWYGDPLTQADLASLLVTGRTLQRVGDLSTLSGEEKEVVTEQALSMLGASLAGFAESSLGQVLPFTTFTVDPSRIANEVDPNARFTLGVGLTEDLSVTYSVALNNSRSRLWVVDYLLPKSVEVRGTQLEDEYTGGVSQRLFFDFHQRAAARRADTRRRVGLIRLVGAPPGLEAPLEEKIETKADQRYDYWKTVDDVRRLSNLLREHGYLGVLIDVQTVPVEEEDLVDIVYRVDPGAPVEIVWRGDDPGDRVRDTVTGAWDGRVPESLLITELARLGLRELWRQRYYQASIESRLEDAPDGARRAIFDVAKGPQSAGLDVVFEGNEALSNQELRGALPSSSSTDLYDLVFANRQDLRETVERFYASRGYLDAQVTDVTQESAAPNGRFRVTVRVLEGDVSAIATVELEGATSIPASTLLDRLSQQPGQPFRFSVYQQDRTTLNSIYRGEGFVEARVRGDLQRTAAGLAVVYQIDEGPRVVVGNIRIVGNQVTRTSIIRRQLTLREGDPLRLSDLTDAQKRLYELGIFRSVDVRVESTQPGAVERDVIVEVIETSDLNVSYGLRYSTQEKLQVQTQLGVPNALGAGQHVGLNVRADNNESLFRATFHTPYLFSRFKLGTDVFVSRETEDAEFFLDRLWSLTFQQNRELNDWMELQWSYNFRRAQTIGKVGDNFVFTIYTNTLRTSLIEDRRDSLIRPTRGRYWSVTLEGAPAQLPNDVNFVKTFGQLITFVPLGHDIVWAASYRLGIAEAFDQILPGDDRFVAGGYDSVRGYDQDSLGPEDPRTGTVIGGEGIAVFNQEIRFPIYRWIQGGAFFDAGNVFLDKSDFDPFDLRSSAGVGIRLVLPFGIVRTDWAWPFNRRSSICRPEDDPFQPCPGDPASQFWFSFGHAF